MTDRLDRIETALERITAKQEEFQQGLIELRGSHALLQDELNQTAQIQRTFLELMTEDRQRWREERAEQSAQIQTLIEGNCSTRLTKASLQQKMVSFCHEGTAPSR